LGLQLLLQGSWHDRLCLVVAARKIENRVFH
jgi:hypothetical protein